jgi:hypothetical protein
MPSLGDWRAAYAYISQQALDRSDEVLFVQVKFADDGTECPGYPAANAVSIHRGAWCTNAGVDHDVDLVVQCPEPSLIKGFVARNGGLSYSAPLKEALVFGSYQPVDLHETRHYNGENGRAWVKRMEGPEQPLVAATREETIRQWMEDIVASEQNQFPVSLVTSVAPDHRSSSTRSAPVSSQAIQQEAQQERLEPLAAFRIPPLPRAYHARLERTCRPTVARYVQFKLLSSYSSPERLSDNIDVMDLLTFGIPLPELNSLLLPSSSLQSTTCSDEQQLTDTPAPIADPSYQRMHAVRSYPYLNLL